MQHKVLLKQCVSLSNMSRFLPLEGESDPHVILGLDLSASYLFVADSVRKVMVIVILFICMSCGIYCSINILSM